MVFDTEYWCRDISNRDSNPGSAACTGSWHIGRLEITYIIGKTYNVIQNNNAYGLNYFIYLIKTQEMITAYIVDLN